MQGVLAQKTILTKNVVRPLLIHYGIMNYILQEQS